MIKSGVIISVSLSTQVKKQAGCTYEAYELILKNSEGEIETIQKPVQGFKFNPALKEALSSLATGDEVTVLMEKNAAGFWEVQSVTKGITEVQQVPSSKTSPSPPGNKVIGSNYETAAERTARQVLIVRQSSLANAIATLSVGAKAPLIPEAVMVVE